MPVIDINMFAVLAAAIVNMVIGFIWYSPAVFGNTWMKASGITEKKIQESKKEGMVKKFFLAFLGTLVMSYVLAHFIDYAGATTLSAGAQAGLWLWLGFIAPVLLGGVLWEGKSYLSYSINVLHYLAALVIMSMILAVWV